MSELLPGYAELHCLSAFSFLRGASHPEELVERAQAQGYAALAITDECSLTGAVRAHLAAKDAGLPLVIGSEFTLDDGLKLVLHAVDRDSYGDLAALITRARRRAIKGHYRVTRDDVADLGRRCLALWIPGAAIAADEARFCADAFGARAAMAAELFARGGERARLADLTAVSRATGLALVAAGDVHMHVRARRMLQDTMTAIRVGTPLAQCGYALFANGERHLRSRARLATIYPRALLEASVEHAARCRFSLDCLRYEYPDEIVPAGATPASHLRALTEAGLVRRYPRAAGDRGSRVPPKVREQIEHELALIAELAYEPYFLTVHDIVAFARSRGILCQGRGSAANSAVCYALGITEVDPTRMSMLFERFVSRERDEPPDIDVDFEHQRREEVMQYVYAKYGRDRAALAATLITYRTKSAVRDIAKALGFGLAEIDRLTRVFAWWDGRTIEVARIREAGFDPASPLIARLVHLAGELIGMPRHLSQHVGGFVIARGSIERMVPVENAAMVDRTVIQWDKDDLDAMGLLKVDCLALGMLSAIRRALSMVSAWHERPLAMQDIPAEDPEVYAMIQRADTIGVFQIESRAQQSMLPRLKPANFYDLVIEVAIVRPGPIQGGMVHPYLRRRQGLEPVTYPERGGARGARAHARRAHLPGAGDAARDRHRRLHARRIRRAAALDGGLAAQGRAREVRAAPRRRHGEERLQRGVRAADLPADPRLRRVRLPGVAFGVVLAAGLRVVVAQALPSGGVHRGAPQRAADGVLRAGAARAGCAAPWRRGARGRRRDERMGLHAGKAAAGDPRSAAACAGIVRFRRRVVRGGIAGAAPGPADDRRLRRAGSGAHRRGTHRSALRIGRRSRAPRGARRPRSCAPSPTPVRSRPSPAIATPRCGTSPAWRSCRRSSPAARSPRRRRCCRRPAKARTSSPTTAASG